MTTQNTTIEQNNVNASRAVAQSLGVAMEPELTEFSSANIVDHTPVLATEKPGGESEKPRPRSAIEQNCDGLAAEAKKVIDDTALLVTKKINELRRQLDEIEALALQGATESKAKIDDQMALIAQVSEASNRVEAGFPELRRLVGMAART
jgi:hypothetical protein